MDFASFEAESYFTDIPIVSQIFLFTAKIRGGIGEE